VYGAWLAVLLLACGSRSDLLEESGGPSGVPSSSAHPNAARGDAGALPARQIRAAASAAAAPRIPPTPVRIVAEDAGDDGGG
jgi:hypothetical protein